jgi:hypothetical protein
VSTEPVTYDISANDKTNEQALLGAILDGQPLAIHDSSHPATEPRPASRCQLCQQTRPAYLYTAFGEPWETPTQHQLCPRCWSRAETADGAGDPLDLPYLCRMAKKQTDALNAKAVNA